MVDRVLMHRARFVPADDMEVEGCLLGYSPAFEPDALNVVVAEVVKDRLHMVVERLDSLPFDVLDTGAEVPDLLGDISTLGLKILVILQLVLDLVGLTLDNAQLLFDLPC